MSQIILIRPGSTDYDHQGRIQGTLDIPLSDQGRQEAAVAAESLLPKALKAIYAAPCQAAQETGRIVASALKLKLRTIDKFQNIDHGLWQGMLIDEVKRKQPKVYKQWHDHPENVCPPEGEMLSEADERIGAALDKLRRKHRGETIGLVISEPLASLVHSRLRGAAPCDLWKNAHACGSIEVVDLPQTNGAVAVVAAK